MAALRIHRPMDPGQGTHRREPTDPTDAPKGNDGRFVVVHPDDEDSSITHIVSNTGDSHTGNEVAAFRETKTGNSIGYAVRRLERESATTNPRVIPMTNPDDWPIDSGDTILGECESCGQLRPLQLVEDPKVREKIIDPYPTSVGWWCRPCHDRRNDEA